LFFSKIITFHQKRFGFELLIDPIYLIRLKKNEVKKRQNRCFSRSNKELGLTKNPNFQYIDGFDLKSIELAILVCF